MCGIFGVASKYSLSVGDGLFLKGCMIAGAVRGVDSTGLVFLNKDEVRFMKRAVNGTTMVTDHFNPTKQMNTLTHSVIGHNRAATIGSVSQETAHPFIESPLIGVHNGTLDKGWQGKLQVAKNCDVDSRGLYRAMAARGVDWVAKNLHGAAALVWADYTTQQTFVYLNNNQRTLHYAKSNLNKLYYASEAGMLQWMMERSKITIKGEIHKFEAGKLYNITGGEVKVVRDLEGPKVEKVQNYSRYHQKPIDYSTPVTGKFNKSNLKSRNMKQDGVKFRGLCMTKKELKAGITSEWAERGYDQYTCCCCNEPIRDAGFYENADKADQKFHKSCFNVFRTMIDAKCNVLSIVRDPKLAPNEVKIA